MPRGVRGADNKIIGNDIVVWKGLKKYNIDKWSDRADPDGWGSCFEIRWLREAPLRR